MGLKKNSPGCACCGGQVYVCGFLDASNTTWKYGPDGTLAWVVGHGATCNSIAVDSDGNVYTGGDAEAISGNSYTTRKYDSSGSLLWSAAHGAGVNEIAVDPFGNVFTNGGVGTGLNSLRKYNSAGTLQWSYQFHDGRDGWTVEADSAGNCYATSNFQDPFDAANITDRVVWKFDSAGAVTWGIRLRGNIHRSLGLNAANDRLFVATASGTAQIIELDPATGVEVAAGGFPIAVGAGGGYKIALDADGNIFVHNTNVNLEKFSSAGVSLWEFSTGSGGSDVDVAPDGHSYFVNATAGDQIRKIDSAGAEVINWTPDNAVALTGVCVDPGRTGAFR